MTAEKLLLFIVIFPTILSIIAYFLGNKTELGRSILLITVTLINFLVVLYLFKFIKTDTIEISVPYVMGTGLHLKLNSFRYVFVFITSFVWFIVTVYSTQYLISYIHRNRYYLFFMITYVGTIGIFVSEDLLNLFTFFEIMSFASYPLIIHDEDKKAHSAGKTYIIMATAGGLVLLMGIFILYTYTNTLDIGHLSVLMPQLGNIKYVISVLFIIGFGVKAGMAPLHIWLPKAHPAAPTPASAILSGILVKTGIFGIILTVVFMMDGDLYLSIGLIIIGFVNMFTGGFLAIFQNNIKTTLAYSSMSQLGYLFLGIGCIGLLGDHKALAIYATLFHVFNHAIFKVMLFMGIGIIYMVTHKLNINDIQGFGRFKALLKLTFFIGFCAIIGLPGFSGFASKTMIHHALTEALHLYSDTLKIAADVIFYLCSSFTTAYLLKLYIAIFVENNSKFYSTQRKFINRRALFPMVASAALVLYFGLKPNKFLSQFVGINKVFHLHEDGVFDFHFYSFSTILSSMITIGLGIIIYKLFITKKLMTYSEGKKVYINPTGNWYNLEKNFYKPLLRFSFKFSTLILHFIDNMFLHIYQFIIHIIKNISSIEYIEFENPIEKIGQSLIFIYHAIKNKTNNSMNTVKKTNFDNIEEKIDIHTTAVKTTFSKDIKEISYKMNSITYSIFLLAGVLVFILLYVLIYR